MLVHQELHVQSIRRLSFRQVHLRDDAHRSGQPHSPHRRRDLDGEGRGLRAYVSDADRRAREYGRQADTKM